MRAQARIACLVPIVVVAASAGAAAAAPAPVAVRCPSGIVAVKWDAQGHVQVLEYRIDPHDIQHPVPTGRILAYADATTRTLKSTQRGAEAAAA